MSARRRHNGYGWRDACLVVVMATGVGGMSAWASAEGPAVAEPAQTLPQPPGEAEAAVPAEPAPDDAAPAVEADDVDKANDAVDDAALLEQFRVAPASFNLNSYIHFDDDGNVRNEQHNMGMNLNIFYGLDVTPRAYRNFKIDSFITDAGEELDVQHHMAGEQAIHHHNHGNQAPRFNVNFQVTRPKQPAEVVRRLKGSVEVIMPMGEPRHAVLSPVKDVLGKRVHIANFPGSELQISRDNDRLRIQMDAELASLMSQVRFFGADDREIPAQSRGTGRHGDQHHHYYQFDVPEDGKVMLTFLSETRVLRVPFELVDIPLPQSGGSGSIDLVIRAEAEVPLVRNAGPGDGDLEVRVE